MSEITPEFVIEHIDENINKLNDQHLIERFQKNNKLIDDLQRLFENTIHDLKQDINKQSDFRYDILNAKINSDTLELRTDLDEKITFKFNILDEKIETNKKYYMEMFQTRDEHTKHALDNITKLINEKIISFDKLTDEKVKALESLASKTALTLETAAFEKAVSLEKYTDTRIQTLQDAINDNLKHFDTVRTMNESALREWKTDANTWRSTMSERERNFATQSDFISLKERIDKQDGSTKGYQTSWAIAVTIITLIIAMTSIYNKTSDSPTLQQSSANGITLQTLTRDINDIKDLVRSLHPSP